MNITVTHTLAPEIIELLQNLGNPRERIAPADVVKETTPVKEIKAKKAEPKAAPKPEEPTAVKQETAPVEKEISFEDIRLIVQEKAQGGKRDEVKKLLTEFGVEKVSALAKDQYQTFYIKVDNL